MNTTLIPMFANIMVLSIIIGAWPCLSNLNRIAITCNEEDREGLIKFKQALLDPHGLLSSWKNGEDCCKWRGVTCHKVTGRVTKLELQSVPVMPGDNDWIGVETLSYSFSHTNCTPLGARELSSGLVSLRYLSDLDLSGIWYANTTVIPPFFGSMKRLKHLRLEGNNARYKDGCDLLSPIDYQFMLVFPESSHSNLVVDDVSWISHLQTLESLEMGTIRFEKLHEFMQVLNNNLSSLSHLGLPNCQLENSHISHLNFTFLSRLQYLNLSMNRLHGQIPNAFGNMTSLQYLDLSRNNFNSEVPVSFGDPNSLVYIDIRLNKFDNIVDGLLTLLKNNQNLKSLRAACGDKPRKPSQMGFPYHYNHSFGSIGGNLELFELTRCLLPGSLPVWFYEMKRLKYLLLHSNSLQGSIPVIPNLKVIDLSKNSLDVVNTTSLAMLPSLESLRLSHNNLKVDILESLSALRNLRKLDLSNNQMNGTIPSTISRLSTLKAIRLDHNNLQGSIPESLGTMPNLREVCLSTNRLDGTIPSSLGKLMFLDRLYLDGNRLEGHIPDSFKQLSTLRFLDLSRNRLNGTIPISFGQLSNLVQLVVSDNLLEGTISESHFVNLSKLKLLDISQNNLTFKVNSVWIPPFQLLFIGLGSCKLETEFPRWIQTQRIATTLILSNAHINGPIPKWLCDMQFSYLDLSHNSLLGEIPKFSSIYLEYINLSNNLISSHLPLNISKMMPNLRYLYLSNNSISSTLPLWLCDMERLIHLDLSKNNLSGSILDCWKNTSKLYLINFSSNRFSGVIPKSLVYIPFLVSLHLNNNSLSGRFPEHSEQWPCLVILDLGENNLFGNLPSSISMSSGLQILRLRGNKFDGIIPLDFCSLVDLHILDLAANNLTGSIPSCFENMNGMKKGVDRHNEAGGFSFSVSLPSSEASPNWKEEHLLETMKGVNIEYTTNSELLVYLDLSNNHLVGSMPEKLGALTGLHGLNLSHNQLSGSIPSNIKNLALLESLDLSNNQLSGQIPDGISSLSALSHLNLENNNLSGHVPRGTQISTIYDENPSIFNGNPYLCGDPFPRKCNGTEPPQAPKSTLIMEKEEHISDGFILHIAVAVGYITGFLGFILFWIFKKSWRIACFKFVDEIAEKVFVTVLVKLAKFQRK